MNKCILLFSTIMSNSLLQDLGHGIWLTEPQSCLCDRTKCKHIISLGEKLQVRLLEKHKLFRPKYITEMERGKCRGRRSELNVCVVLLLVCMISFFHHPDISHVERELGPAALMEDVVKTWLVEGTASMITSQESSLCDSEHLVI